ncbi:hypothetical protein [Sphingobacterium sp. BIGb0165]|uniref:hypothetical protein n=1 Tax=Sphingobacterium sp. BIGb0165 TaxID=2940615 RepID=UPI002167E4CA|nr:hypothetical protein [Sphingobacterium sp. BIGb0165]MCS4224495.1 hypothetical protein [Sphingobacterium sp. BIGb0165]
MKKIIPDEELITIGKMRKDPFIMAMEEKIAWKKDLGKDIRCHLFSQQLPLIYHKDGQMIAEYQDGTIRII